jgi:hypothetical protein
VLRFSRQKITPSRWPRSAIRAKVCSAFTHMSPLITSTGLIGRPLPTVQADAMQVPSRNTRLGRDADRHLPRWRGSSAIWVGEVAGDISRHRGEPSSRRPQTIYVVSSPILNLDPETKIVDVPHSLNDRQLNEDHLRQAARVKSVIISPI